MFCPDRFTDAAGGLSKQSAAYLENDTDGIQNICDRIRIIEIISGSANSNGESAVVGVGIGKF